MAVKAVIQNPRKIKDLDIETYKRDLEATNQSNMIVLVQYIMDEL